MVENSRLSTVFTSWVTPNRREAMVILRLSVINFIKDGVRKVMLNREWFLLNEQDVNFIKVEYTKYLIYSSYIKSCWNLTGSRQVADSTPELNDIIRIWLEVLQWNQKDWRPHISVWLLLLFCTILNFIRLFFFTYVLFHSAYILVILANFVLSRYFFNFWCREIVSLSNCDLWLPIIHSQNGLWNRRSKTEALEGKPVPLSLYSPQRSHGLPRTWNRSFTVRSRCLISWAMIQSHSPLTARIFYANFPFPITVPFVNLICTSY
jgi:hypothetical protein